MIKIGANEISELEVVLNKTLHSAKTMNGMQIAVPQLTSEQFRKAAMIALQYLTMEAFGMGDVVTASDFHHYVHFGKDDKIG